MITEKKYLEAKKVIEEYSEQLRVSIILDNKRLKEQQAIREKKCSDHYYVPRGKWQSGMVCQDCGKIIG